MLQVICHHAKPGEIDPDAIGPTTQAHSMGIRGAPMRRFSRWRGVPN